MLTTGTLIRQVPQAHYCMLMATPILGVLTSPMIQVARSPMVGKVGVDPRDGSSYNYFRNNRARLSLRRTSRDLRD